jgi:hypothetical protein
MAGIFGTEVVGEVAVVVAAGLTVVGGVDLFELPSVARAPCSHEVNAVANTRTAPST